jgi:hypothetical protein
MKYLIVGAGTSLAIYIVDEKNEDSSLQQKKSQSMLEESSNCSNMQLFCYFISYYRMEVACIEFPVQGKLSLAEKVSVLTIC